MIFVSFLWKAVRRITIGLAVCILAALAAGTIYQFVSTNLDESNYPPPGQILDVEGRSIHLNCTGEGSPTVVLESGLGGGSLDWGLVQPEVAMFSRVCSYDRAGIAWSSSSDGPRDAIKITDELHKLLGAAHIAPPFVLVGHSIGGVYVQMFAARFHNEVAGVVLIDSSHESQLSRISGIPGFVPYLAKASAPIGIARIVNNLEDAPNFSPEAKAKRAALYSRNASVYASADEMSAISDSLAQLRDAPMRLGDKPLFVLSRGLREGTSPEIEAAWRELQIELADRSSNGKLVIAEKSGHYIHFSEPELVVDAIRKVVRATSNNP